MEYIKTMRKINLFSLGFIIGMLTVIGWIGVVSINVVSQLDDINMSSFNQNSIIEDCNCDLEVLNKTLECEREIFHLVQYYEIDK